MITMLNILQMMCIAEEMDYKTKTNKPFVDADSMILDLDIKGVVTTNGGCYDISFSSPYDETLFKLKYAHIL